MLFFLIFLLEVLNNSFNNNKTNFVIIEETYTFIKP